MNKPDESKWIKFSRRESFFRLWLDYSDGLGKEIGGEPGAGIFFTPQAYYRWSPEIYDAIQKVVLAKPRERETREGILPTVIALYLELYTERGLRLRELIRAGNIGIDYIDNGLFQQVLYLQERVKHQPFDLPFRIRHRDYLWAFNRIKEASWNNGGDFELDIGEYEFNEEGVDILLVDEEYFSATIFEVSGKISPRLILIAKQTRDMELMQYEFISSYWNKLQDMGTACLYIAYSSPDVLEELIFNFLLGIIHDLPLHEAVYNAGRLQKSGVINTLLLASPVSNQWLRMADALESFKTKVHDYGKVLSPGDSEEFLERLIKRDEKTGDNLRELLPKSWLTSYFRGYKFGNMTFRGEGTGLVPLSGEHRQLEQQESYFRQTTNDLRAFVSDKAVFSAIRAEQERRVDVTLEELNSYLTYSPMDKYRWLLSGTQYRLNVSIGQPSYYNLVEGQVPAIDPLLPDPEDGKGHYLDIVVFPKDFSLSSPASQTIYLPLLGGTDHAQFIIHPPDMSSTASLRIGVFYKNNLLQAFLLEARIAQSEKALPYVHDEAAVKVTLDLSKSWKFTNLDELKPRGLYIGINENGDNTHSIFLKKDSLAQEIGGLNVTIIDEAQQKFRTLLNEAYQNPKGDDDIRAFAWMGNSYYSKIFHANGREFSRELIAFRRSENENITIGRHNINYSFPWQLIYDYMLPLERVGKAPAPVCRGKALNPADYRDFVCQPGQGCPHNPDLYTYCLDGFWGIRHRIEQILSAKRPLDEKEDITIKKQPAILYCNNIIDAYTTQLSANMQSRFGARELDHDCNFMDLLWNDESRPAAMVVFGHLETKDITGEPPGPRIITFPKKNWPAVPALEIPLGKWIFHQLLDSRLRDLKFWSADPLPLVMLINCSSHELTIKALNSLVEDFHTAGASAIVSTECDITSDVGVRFVEQVLDGMYNKELELGEAIQQFNKDLSASGIAPAFVFTCFGNLNLKFIK